MRLKYPERFLFITLAALCFFYLAHIAFIRYRLNKWYSHYIDKGQTGLRVFYYPNKDFSGVHDQTEVLQGVSYSNSKDSRFKKSIFSLRAIGVFSPPRTGHYKFFLRSDDGSKLYLDNKLIIDNFDIHPSVEKAKTVFLKKGRHFLVIEYFQFFGNSELEFNWLETGESDKNADLSSFFYPVISGIQLDRDMEQLGRLLKSPNGIYLILLAITILFWLVLKYRKKIYSLLINFSGRCKRHEILCIILLLIIFLMINFYPIIFKGKTLVSAAGSSHVIDGGGPYWEIEPFIYLNHYYYFVARTIPLWNPYNGTGFPLAAMMNSGSFSLIPFLMSLYPSHLTMDIFMLFRLFITGFFMYLFLRQIGFNMGVSTIGGVYFMLAPPHIVCINQFQMDTVIFTPAILYFMEKGFSDCNKKYWMLTAIFIALAVLGGNPEEIFLVMALITLYLFIRIFFTKSLFKIEYIKSFFWSLITGVCLSSFFVLPAIEFFINSDIAADRSYKSGVEFIRFILLRIIPPKISHIRHDAFYLGVIPIFLIFVNILNFRDIKKNNKGYKIFSLTYIILFLIMLSDNPIANCIKKAPLISHIWWSKYTSTFYIALAVFICFGLDILLQARRHIRLAGVFVATLLLIDLYIFIPRMYTGRQDRLPYPRAVTYLKHLLKKGHFRVWVYGSTHILEPNRGCIYQLPVLGYSGLLRPKRYTDFHEYFFDNAWDGTMEKAYRAVDLLGIKYLYSNKGYLLFGDMDKLIFGKLKFKAERDIQGAFYSVWGKVKHGILLNSDELAIFSTTIENDSILKFSIAPDPFYQNIDDNGVITFSIDIISNGNESSIFKKGLMFNNEEWHDYAIDLSRYKYTKIDLVFKVEARIPGIWADIISADRIDSKVEISDKKWKVIYCSDVNGDVIYENNDALPRAYIVHKAITKKRDEVLEVLTDPSFDIRHSIVLEKDISKEVFNREETITTDNSMAKIIEYTPNHISIKADMENSGFLVLSDTYYPGWKAFVDGRRSEIYLTNYLFRSVYVGKGKHTVEFVYSPFSFRLGVIVSLIAAICLLYGFARSK